MLSSSIPIFGAKRFFLPIFIFSTDADNTASAPKVQLEPEGNAVPLPSLFGLVLRDNVCVLNTGGVAWAVEWCPMSMVAEYDGWSLFVSFQLKLTSHI